MKSIQTRMSGFGLNNLPIANWLGRAATFAAFVTVGAVTLGLL